MKNKAVSPQLIDEKVILTMIACSVLALMVLAFRYVTEDRPDFLPVSISVKNGPLYTDELILFTAEGKDIKTKSLVWDFGDKSKQINKNITAIHSYKTPGLYNITLTINGGRHEYKTIYITKAPQVVNPNLIAQFTGSEKVIVGKPVTFKDFTPNAYKWEWKFGESNSVDATTQQPTYTFKTLGWTYVRLVVTTHEDGKDVTKNGELKVFVEPKPKVKTPESIGSRGEDKFPPVGSDPTEPPLLPKTDTSKAVTPTPPKPIAPDITEDQMATMLKKVVDGDKVASDFSKYMNGNLNITVYSNGKGMTFNSFCDQLRKIKKSNDLRTFKVVNVEKDSTNYIKSMVIKYETYGWIGRKLH